MLSSTVVFRYAEKWRREEIQKLSFFEKMLVILNTNFLGALFLISSVSNHFSQIEGQLKRLLTQLQDIEQMKDELDEDEYTSMKKVKMGFLRFPSGP